MGLADWHFTLSWGLVIWLCIGTVITAWVALRPRMFRPLLIVISVATSGIIIQGYGIVDELMVMSVLLGGLLVISVRPVLRARTNGTRLHRELFSILMIYLFFQSIRGALVLEDWRILRFVLLFGSLALLVMFGRGVVFGNHHPKMMTWIVVLSALAYLLTYLGQGLYYEHVMNISRFEMQGITWSGSAYALFPLVVAIPAAFLLLKDHNLVGKMVGVIVLMIAALVGGYYDSRMVWLMLSFFLFVAGFTIGLRRVVIPTLCVMSLSAVGLWSLYGGPFNISFTLTPGRDIASLHDIDRFLAFVGALTAVKSDLTRLIIGDGFWVHRFSLITPFQEIFSAHGLGAGSGIVRTTGFSAFLIDTGLIGTSLLFSNFLLAAREIIRQTKQELRNNRPLLLSALLIACLVLFVTNILDIVLLYLLIMPGGLLAQLSQFGAKLPGPIFGHMNTPSGKK